MTKKSDSNWWDLEIHVFQFWAMELGCSVVGLDYVSPFQQIILQKPALQNFMPFLALLANDSENSHSFQTLFYGGIDFMSNKMIGLFNAIDLCLAFLNVSFSKRVRRNSVSILTVV